MANYSESFNTSIGLAKKLVRSGTGIGTRLYYSKGGTPEQWKEERARIKISITDNITGRARILKAVISDPRNIKESLYTPYKRVKIVEYSTGLTIFLGRIEISEPKYDSQFGQILQITARDYSNELIERKVSSDYSSSPGASKRSALIDQVIQDYRYGASSITTNIEESGSSDTLTRNYTRTGRFPLELIEELAKEDPWTDATWSANGKVYVYNGSTYTDETTDADDDGAADVSLMNGATHYLYLGQNNPFIGATFDLSTNGNYGTVTWEYYNGASWAALTTSENYDFTADGSEKWSLPPDWATVAVNSTTKYWVRCSVASVTTQAIATTISCIRGFGYDYYVDDNQVFQYFRRGSKPSGGPTANGLTVALGEAPSTSKRAMLADYNFSDQPAELVTRVTVYGTDTDGTNVSCTETNSDLETELEVIKEKEEYVWGADMDNTTLTTYCTNRAKALLNYKGTDSLIRGTFKIVKYPYYGSAGSETLVRVGDLVHITCAPKSIDDDFLVLEVKYEEPNGISTIKVVSNIYGRSFSPFETASILSGLRSGADINLSSAKIGDLFVGNAQIGSLEASKITTGTLSANVQITVGSGTSALGTAMSGARVQILSTGIKAYDSSGNQRVQISNDGSGWFGSSTGFAWTTSGALSITGGASGVKLSSAGLNIWGDAMLTTRATEAGTIQCKVDSTGAISAGAGAVLLNSSGITIDGSGAATQVLCFKYSTQSSYIYAGSSTFNIQMANATSSFNINFSTWGIFSFEPSNTRITLPTGCTDLFVASNGTLTLGASTYLWAKVYTDKMHKVTQDGSYYNTMYDIRPYSTTSWLGLGTSSGQYWQAAYIGTVNYSTLTAFDDFDDIKLIKQMKPKKDNTFEIDPDTIPDILKISKSEYSKMIDEKLAAEILDLNREYTENITNKNLSDTEKLKLKERKDLYIANRKLMFKQAKNEYIPPVSLMKEMGLAMGAIRQIATRIEELENIVTALLKE